jgi:hypothetical protein
MENYGYDGYDGYGSSDYYHGDFPYGEYDNGDYGYGDYGYGDSYNDDYGYGDYEMFPEGEAMIYELMKNLTHNLTDAIQPGLASLLGSNSGITFKGPVEGDINIYLSDNCDKGCSHSEKSGNGRHGG